MATISVAPAAAVIAAGHAARSASPSNGHVITGADLVFILGAAAVVALIAFVLIFILSRRF